METQKVPRSLQRKKKKITILIQLSQKTNATLENDKSLQFFSKI